MTATLTDGLQIVPGYRLETRLGKGGFGEVWRAVGPGKIAVALKIIAAKGSKTGEREFKSLDLLRDLRHPNLLPIQAYWLLDDDGQVIEDDRVPTSIVIAMLLGGKNLRQRLNECREGGVAGIPPRELLELLRDAAKGIDFLNKPVHQLGNRVVAIQHRDIKPENLMLVGGGVMVADFGIAGVMESNSAHTTNAAMTFNYAAPELFDYTATAWTDQYALAITYGELRLGALPFPSHSSPLQVIRIHTEGRHDFSKLSPGEQAVLKRATGKVPEQRYPTCQDMIAELDAAVRAAGLLDEVLPLERTVDERNIPTELQSTRLVINDSTGPATTPLLPAAPELPSTATYRSPTGKTAPQTIETLPDSLPATQIYRTHARSSRPLWIAGVVAVVALLAVAVWASRTGPHDTSNAGAKSLDPKSSEVKDSTASSRDSTPSATNLAKRNAAREQAVQAMQAQRYAEAVQTLDPIFEQRVATTEDYVLRGNAFLALADAGESPAENYARAAADFAKAELPREQLRALTRQGRWLLDHNFAKQAVAPLRQAIGLKKSPDLQLSLCQALLATNDAATARDEAFVTLAELPKEVTEAADVATVARLHHVSARACLALAKAVEADPELATKVETWDLESDQHYREAVALATTGQLDELSAWQVEHSSFRKLPRMVAREERRLRKERITALTKVAEQSPNIAAKWLELAELEQLDGQAKLAAAHFARGYGQQALDFARSGKLDEAIDAAAKASEQDAGLLLVQHAHALIAAGQGLDKDAVALLDTVLARSPTKGNDRWQILSDRGAASSRLAAGMSGTRQDWIKARADFEAAIESFPQPDVAPSDGAPVTTSQQSLARLHHDRATTLEAIAGDSEKPDLALLELAEKAFVAATNWNPNEPRFALSAGRTLLRQARSGVPGSAELLDRAATFLVAATKLDDQRAESHFTLGECQLLRGKTAEAQVAFDKSVERAERDSAEQRFQYSLQQSLAYLRAPRNDATALAAAERAISLQRSEPSAHFARGLALRNLKRANDAIAAFNDTLSLQPKHVAALVARSQLLIEHPNATAKQLDQANQDIETALAVAATDELKAEAFYVRSLAALKTHVSNVTQATTAETALLNAQRDLLQANKLTPTNTVYAQAATELFDYAAKFNWADAKRKTDSELLQRDWKAARRK